MPGIAVRTPIVLANCFDEQGHHAVVPDDEYGEFALVAGLLARDHRRIALLTLPETVSAHPLRLAGYKTALQGAGIPLNPALVRVATSADREDELDGLGDILDGIFDRAEPPTALCCANDKMAMRVYSLLSERGLSVPDDVSVVGYDDYRVISEQLRPSLTSVSLAYEEIGVRAALALLDAIRGHPPTTGIERVRGSIAWRGSVRSLV